MSQKQLIALIVVLLLIACGPLLVFRDRHADMPDFAALAAGNGETSALTRLNARGEQVDDFIWPHGSPYAFAVSHENNQINALKGNSDRHLRIYDGDFNLVKDIPFSERGMRARIHEDERGILYYGGTRFVAPDYAPEVWYCDGDGPGRPAYLLRIECDPPGAIARADGRVMPFQTAVLGRKSVESLMADRTLTRMGYYRIDDTPIGPLRYKLLDDYLHPLVERYPAMNGQQVLLYRPGGSSGELYLLRDAGR